LPHHRARIGLALARSWRRSASNIIKNVINGAHHQMSRHLSQHRVGARHRKSISRHLKHQETSRQLAASSSGGAPRAKRRVTHLVRRRKQSRIKQAAGE